MKAQILRPLLREPMVFLQRAPDHFILLQLWANMLLVFMHKVSVAVVVMAAIPEDLLLLVVLEAAPAMAAQLL